MAQVLPPGIEIASVKIVRLAGHPMFTKIQPSSTVRPDPGLGKLIDAVDIVIRPASDGMAFDAARLQRLGAALIAKTESRVSRGDKSIDVRPYIADVSVLDGDAGAKICGALDWTVAPLVRVRVRMTAEGSAKPSEVARALGVWGSDDPRGEHALVARLGVVEVGTALASVVETTALQPTA
jgi:hypothetical protein